jgi:hypothetical protein
MNAVLASLALLLSAVVLFIVPGEGAAALLVCGVVASIAGFIIYQSGDNKTFLLRLFVGALLVRVLVGTIISVMDFHAFFGGDALTYDFFGHAMLKGWQGDKYYETYANLFIGVAGSSAWGLLYLIAAIYALIGRNMLAVQFFNAVLGAATAPIIFLCARHIFKNLKVGQVAGYFVAFYPSLVLWSSQGLKDGPIVFFLALSILATLRLGEKYSLKYLAVLCFSLTALLSLRFYIFYMMVVAIGGAFLVGMRPATARSLARQFAIIVGVGLALTYMGVLRSANVQLEAYANLERIQVSRADQATANTGFAKDVDVSTTSGALSAIPMGATYLLFAPFPWQLASLRQSITLPEMIIWWASFPLLVLGLWFTVKHRLRQSLPILLFTAMLTLAYSIFQGNVGTAYRQRSQLLVFYFIFVSVGYVLLKERRDDRRAREMGAKKLAMTERRQQRV